ncbi:MAG TPA: hypothetical protein DEW46_18575, partial [Verrucomicrobia bacterium]|nr:hypothetical protein [Verrucomicrobiota bacterium]
MHFRPLRESLRFRMGRTPVDDRGPRVVEPVRKDAFLQARVADPSDQCLNRGADGIGVGIDSCSDWHQALMDRSNFTDELCQRRNNTDTFPGLLWPNPLTRPFDTEADSDPDPDLALPLTFWDDLYLEPVRKGLRVRMGRYPAEIAEGAEGGGILGG